MCCAKAAGHAGVGSVFDLSNAQVAKILGAKVIIVTQGGIGKPIDEVSLNQALFEKEGVEIIGVILNKVLGEKVDYITDFARRGLKRKGLDLLGVLPHRTNPLQPVRGFDPRRTAGRTAERSRDACTSWWTTSSSARWARRTRMQFFKRGVLLITPGDREDIILAACTQPGRAERGKDGRHRSDRRLAPSAEAC